MKSPGGIAARYGEDDFARKTPEIHIILLRHEECYAKRIADLEKDE